MDLSLSFEETTQLMEILEERQRVFLREISRAKRHYEYRAGLQKKERLLESIIQKLGATQTAQAI